MATSLNPYISKFSTDFDVEKSSQYKLTIQFPLGGFSIALFDTSNNALIGLEYYSSDLLVSSNDVFRALERALDAKGLSNKTFQSVSCIIDERFCTLVPESLFNEADQTKYLDFAFQLPEGYTIVSEPLSSAQCHIVYALPKALQAKIMSKWKDAQICHSSGVFVNSMMKNNLANGVFVQVRNRDFDMVIKKENNLFFFNNFKFNTKEDFAYFLLFAMEQNACSAQDTPVCFSGLIRPASDIIELCGRYVNNICFVEVPNTLQVSKGLEEVPFQYYFTLYQTLR